MARPRALLLDDDPDSGSPSGALVLTPHWRRAPCASLRERPHATQVPPEELAARIDAYFGECADNGIEPRYTDLAAVIGFSSLVQMINHSRRTPGLMDYISRGLLAVAASYEDATAKGLRTGSFLLGRLQGFDSAEPATQRGENFFSTTQEVNLNVSGIQRPETVGAELTPLEAYQRMIKFKTHGEVQAIAGRTVEAEFTVIEEGEGE